MRKESVFSLRAENLPTPERTGSIPEPTVFLASNVNKSRFPSICNILIYIVLFVVVVVASVLLVFTIMAAIENAQNEITTKPPFECEFYKNFQEISRIFFHPIFEFSRKYGSIN